MDSVFDGGHVATRFISNAAHDAADWAHTALGVCGALIPAAGEICNAANVGLDVARGDWKNLAFDSAIFAMGIVPGGAAVGRGLQIAEETAVVAEDAVQVAKEASTVERIVWPPNRGFAGEPAPASLVPGTVVDRFGAPSGTFVAPEGTPFAMRSLPESALNKPFNSYEVLRPIEVQAGPAAPWFGQPGGGLQFELPNSVQNLIDSGHLRPLGQ